jgi:hypothetical protein
MGTVQFFLWLKKITTQKIIVLYAKSDLMPLRLKS